MAFIEVTDLSVDFPLYHGSARSLKKTVFAAASGRLGKDNQHRVVVRALRDISFTLNSGDRLGLIGRNGAGKTTLLRTIGGIYEPTFGRICVDGSINTLLDPNLGMNPDLTGRENIMLRGLYLGLPQGQIRQLEEDVQDFAELGEFLDLPIRFYSSGMLIRLGFALATSISPQVLLMDEWFMAGDAQFMSKARGRLESMVRGAEVLVLSSHLMAVVEAWCTRVIWMERGRVIADGPAKEVIYQYLHGPQPDEDGEIRPKVPPAKIETALQIEVAPVIDHAAVAHGDVEEEAVEAVEALCEVAPPDDTET